MKRALALLFLCLATGKALADTPKFSVATTVGTAIPMDSPSVVPITWQVLGYYHPTERWSVGVGAGLSFYEKLIVPVYGDVRYQIGRTRKITPHIEMAAGYGFFGGLYLNPSVGIRYTLGKRLRLQLSAGYEMQPLERRKSHTDSYFHSEFAEKLNHNGISIKVGVEF